MRELNYRPSQVRRKVNTDTRTLGIASGAPSSAVSEPGYYRSIVDHILSSASYHRQNSIVYASHLFHEDTLQSIRTYCDGRCDGLFLIIPKSDAAIITALSDRGFPFVIVGDKGADNSVPCSDIDNVAAGISAAEHLISLGHKRIAYTRGSPDASASSGRETGFRSGLIQAGIAVDEELFGPAIGLRQWVLEVVKLPEARRPTAYFCFCDHDAFTLIKILESLGISVPYDVSVMGVDDQHFGSDAPTLTTIRQPYERIATHAVEALLAQLTGNTNVAQRVLIPGELIVRSSTSPRRAE